MFYNFNYITSIYIKVYFSVKFKIDVMQSLSHFQHIIGQIAYYYKIEHFEIGWIIAQFISLFSTQDCAAYAQYSDVSIEVPAACVVLKEGANSDNVSYNNKAHITAIAALIE